jgi:hypothetical protein
MEPSVEEPLRQFVELAVQSQLGEQIEIRTAMRAEKMRPAQI